MLYIAERTLKNVHTTRYHVFTYIYFEITDENVGICNKTNCELAFKKKVDNVAINTTNEYHHFEPYLKAIVHKLYF